MPRLGRPGAHVAAAVYAAGRHRLTVKAALRRADARYARQKQLYRRRRAWRPRAASIARDLADGYRGAEDDEAGSSPQL